MSIKLLGRGHQRLIFSLGLFITTACTKDMARQERLSAQNHVMPAAVAHTVETQASLEALPSENMQGAATLEFLKRGQKEFEIHCTPCHDSAGTGRGIVVARGFNQPLALDSANVRTLSDDRLLEIVTDGIGVMKGYRNMMTTPDRQSIVTYVRSLQLSRHMPARFLTQEDRTKLEKGQDQ